MHGKTFFSCMKDQFSLVVEAGNKQSYIPIMSKLWLAQEAEISASSEFKTDKMPEGSNSDRIRNIKTLRKLPLVNHGLFYTTLGLVQRKYCIISSPHVQRCVAIQQNDYQTSNKLIPDQDHVKLVIFPHLFFFSE